MPRWLAQRRAAQPAKRPSQYNEEAHPVNRVGFFVLLRWTG